MICTNFVPTTRHQHIAYSGKLYSKFYRTKGKTLEKSQGVYILKNHSLNTNRLQTNSECVLFSITAFQQNSDTETSSSLRSSVENIARHSGNISNDSQDKIRLSGYSSHQVRKHDSAKSSSTTASLRKAMGKKGISSQISSKSGASQVSQTYFDFDSKDRR